MKEVKKAVIPVAGLGTRFLPMTKSVPKELLPIVDKPSLQYVVEEVVASGVETIILVNSKGKESVEGYLRHNKEYEDMLKEKGKYYLIEELCKFIDRFDVRVAIQDEPKGLGHAILCARDEVGDDPFVILLPDVIVESDPPCSAQMINAYKKTGCGIIYTEHTPRERLHLYGVLDIENEDGPLYRIKDLVEKPQPESAPSDLTIVGRYLCPASIFKYIEETKPGKGGEIQITDALTKLAKSEGLYGLEHPAKVFDTGDKLTYMKANFYYGVNHPELGSELKKYLESL